MKFVVFSSAAAVLLAIPGVAAAQPSNDACPPGSWFCSPSADAQPSTGNKSGLQPLPADDDATPPPPPRSSPPPVVVYQPPPPVVIARPENPPPYEYAPPPHKPISPPREWGLNLHLEGATIGSGVNGNAGLGGFGGGLRYKPMRYVGLETDLDFLGGHGYSGDLRNETSLTFNALFFANPRDRAQIYFLAGFGWQWAHSTNDPSDPSQNVFDNHYTYFGGQLGIGLELRLTRVLAFNLDFRGFVRTRTDSGAQTQPEFANASTGQVTNSSGGGLITGGMTLYF